MTELTEFLLARIAEDEERGSFDPFDPEFGQARLKAECKAKRRIVSKYVGAAGIAADYDDNEDWAVTGALEETLLLLALPYADHPDYRQDWKP